MNVHFVQFPRWGTITSCERTVFHLPMFKVPVPAYRVDDIIVAVNAENRTQVVVLRVCDISVGPLMKFLGDVDSAKLLKKPSKELWALATTWPEFEASWSSVHGMNPRTDPDVLRVEFGYEPLPLSKEVQEALNPDRYPAWSDELTAILLANARVETKNDSKH